MFVLNKPSEEAIRAFLAAQSEATFSYKAVGETRLAGRPKGYRIDQNRILIGHGEALFTRAAQALKHWRMCRIHLYALHAPAPPIQAGQTLCLCVHSLGLWSLNGCRVVYTLEEEGPICRCAVAYGTLSQHVEEGEERFMVEWDRTADSVWYEIYAFSRPGHFLTRLGYPIARQFQKRFVRESQQAMIKAVHSELQDNPGCIVP